MQQGADAATRAHLYRVAAINLADVAMYEGDYARAEALLDGALETLPDNAFLAPTRARKVVTRYRNRAASATKPGPNANATQGRGASAS